MPNDPDFIDFVIDQVKGGCEMTYRHMFGGTTMYVNSKVIGLICNNQLFVKPTEAGRAYIGSVVEAPPYEGAKNSFLIGDEIEDADWLTKLLLGAGLVELRSISTGTWSYAQSLGSNLDTELGAYIALSIILGFGSLGVISGYLWSQLHYGPNVTG